MRLPDIKVEGVERDRSRPWVYRAVNVNAALEFARQTKTAGYVQFFRGQENATWEPIPSYLRIPEASQEDALRLANRFIEYTRAVSSHSGIHYTADELIAIAQHYGQPSNFLDLTTDPAVAAMFACPPGSKQAGCDASILLYSEKVIEFWRKEIQEHYDANGLELVRVDVANLWRLQAQRGLFLYVASPDLRNFFEPYRIEFPHPAGGYVAAGYELYPARKSALEIQLDLYFHLEELEKGKQIARELIWHVRIPPSTSGAERATPRLATVLGRASDAWVAEEAELHERLRNNFDGIGDWPLRTLSDTFFPSRWRFKRDDLRPHRSWFDEGAMRWLKLADERYVSPAEGERFIVDVDLADYGDRTPWQLDAPRQRIFPVDSRARLLVPQFRVTYSAWTRCQQPEDGATPSEIEERFAHVAQQLWDGLRRKPLTDTQLALCMDQFLLHARFYLDTKIQGDEMHWDRGFGKQNIDHLKVEFSPLGGHSRGVKVLIAALEPCLRPDFDDCIEEIEIHERFRFRHLQQMIYPQYLFDFERFAEMYCVRVLSYQAFVGAITWNENPGLAFNPREIKIFGLS